MSPTRLENNDFGYILGCQRFTSFIHLRGSAPITTEPHNREFRLDLPRRNLHYADLRFDELSPKRIRVAPYGGLGDAIDASSRVGFMACDAIEVDNVAFVTPQHGGEDCLGHVDETYYVGSEHNVYVC